MSKTIPSVTPRLPPISGRARIVAALLTPVGRPWSGGIDCADPPAGPVLDEHLSRPARGGRDRPPADAGLDHRRERAAPGGDLLPPRRRVGHRRDRTGPRAPRPLARPRRQIELGVSSVTIAD